MMGHFGEKISELPWHGWTPGLIDETSTLGDVLRTLPASPPGEYGDGECREVWNEIEFRSVCGGDNVSCEPLPRDYRPTPKNPALIEQR
jgi:hypothetical protein